MKKKVRVYKLGGQQSQIAPQGDQINDIISNKFNPFVNSLRSNVNNAMQAQLQNQMYQQPIFLNGSEYNQNALSGLYNLEAKQKRFNDYNQNFLKNFGNMMTGLKDAEYYKWNVQLNPNQNLDEDTKKAIDAYNRNPNRNWDQFNTLMKPFTPYGSPFGNQGLELGPDGFPIIPNQQKFGGQSLPKFQDGSIMFVQGPKPQKQVNQRIAALENAEYQKELERQKRIAAEEASKTYYINNQKTHIKKSFDPYLNNVVEFSNPISVKDEDGNTMKVDKLSYADWNRLQKGEPLKMFVSDYAFGDRFESLNQMTDWNQDASTSDFKGVRYNTLHLSNKPNNNYNNLYDEWGNSKTNRIGNIVVGKDGRRYEVMNDNVYLTKGPNMGKTGLVIQDISGNYVTLTDEQFKNFVQPTVTQPRQSVQTQHAVTSTNKTQPHTAVPVKSSSKPSTTANTTKPTNTVQPVKTEPDNFDDINNFANGGNLTKYETEGETNENQKNYMLTGDVQYYNQLFPKLFNPRVKQVEFYYRPDQNHFPKKAIEEQTKQATPTNFYTGESYPMLLKPEEQLSTLDYLPTFVQQTNAGKPYTRSMGYDPNFMANNNFMSQYLPQYKFQNGSEKKSPIFTGEHESDLFKATGTPQQDWLRTAAMAQGPMLDLFSSIGRRRTEPIFDNEFERRSEAQNLYNAYAGNMGYDTFNPIGIPVPNNHTPVQFTGFQRGGIKY